MSTSEACPAALSVSRKFSGEIGEHLNSDSPSEVDLESGFLFVKLHLDDKSVRDCRICHLGFDGSSQELRPPIELGCSCKGDLGSAHRQCAETWFKIKGNMICEICGSTAVNVGGEQINQSNDVAAAASLASAAPMILMETRNLWQGHRVLNFLLACMVFAFVLSWLFHFKVLS
ncbi:uncharacterized protein LOC123209644 [Mangifera indica]|uniref:uncharacterized protein LOC123209644 n=1 Tax=Mangifera indica TaxID=29780 RepID=UPI001CF94F1B|nr:uncharacterized protein LOC123209644 [Mangifera indica]